MNFENHNAYPRSHATTKICPQTSRADVTMHTGVTMHSRKPTPPLPRPFLAFALAAFTALAALTAAPQAAAQTAQDIFSNSPLIPDVGNDGPDFTPGESFRLLFLTSTTGNAVPDGIGTYNSRVQSAAANGHADIRNFSAQFRALVSVGINDQEIIDARDNTKTNDRTGSQQTPDPSVPIYWLNGAKVAGSNSDFYDNIWESLAATNEHGNSVANPSEVWTGSRRTGNADWEPGNPVMYGLSIPSPRVGRLSGSGGPIDGGLDQDRADSTLLPLYAVSPVLNVVAIADTTLSALSFEGTSVFTPAFDSATTSYAARVAHDVESITVTPTTTNSIATATISATHNGESALASTPLARGAGASVPLSEGLTHISITVSAVTTYTVSVRRVAPPPPAPLARKVLVGTPLASGLGIGEQFRMLFVTSGTRNGAQGDIAMYNTFVQDAAADASGIAEPIAEFSSQFRALVSSAEVDVRDNTATTGDSVPIYWLGSTKVADNYADFYDGSWDNRNPRDETGAGIIPSGRLILTGSTGSGFGYPGFTVGSGTVRIGRMDRGARGEINSESGNSNNDYHLYALSPVLTVVTDAPVVRTPIPDQTATALSLFSYAFPPNTFYDFNNNNALSYSVTGLPSWLTFQPADVAAASRPRTLRGTPPSSAVEQSPFTITVTASDGDQATADVSDTFTLTVSSALEFDTRYIPLPAASYTYTVDVPLPVLNLLPRTRGGLAPLTYTLHPADALPAGITYNPFTRSLSGTPTETAAPVALTYAVTDANLAVITLTFSLGVAASPTLDSIADQVYTINQPVDFTLPEATGGAASLSYTLVRTNGSPVLPPGLAFDPAARTISGATTYVFGGTNGAALRYTATDANGAAAAQDFTLRTVAAPAFSATATIAALTYTAGTPIAPLTLPEATGGATPLTYSLSPAASVPFGLTLNPTTRVLSGAPAFAVTNAALTYIVTDINGATDTLSFNLTVAATFGFDITAIPAPDAAYQYIVNQPITPLTLPPVTGGTGTLTYALDGVPAGLTFSAGVRTLSGAPTAAVDDAALTYTATDSAASPNSVALTFMVSAASQPTVDFVTAVVGTPDDPYITGEEVNIIIDFSEDVTIIGTPQLALDTGNSDGNGGTAEYVSASNPVTAIFSYTVRAGDNTAALSYTGTDALDLNGGTIRNTANTVDADLTLPTVGSPNSLSGSEAVTLDTTAPVFTSGDTANVVVGTALTFTVYDAEATNNGGAADADVTYRLSGTDAGLFSIDPANGEVTYIAVQNDVATHRIVVTAINTLGNPTTQIVDISVLAVPVPDITDSALSEYTNGVTTFTFTWGEMVSGFETGDITVDGGGTKGAFTGTDPGTVYTLVVTPPTTPTNDGVLTVTVAANAVTGELTKTGNEVKIATQKFDTVAPVFAADTDTVNFAVNTRIGTEVYNAAATDGDVADRYITYSLSGTDAAQFAIGVNNGKVTLTSPSMAAHTFVITATDKGGNTDTITVTVSSALAFYTRYIPVPTAPYIYTIDVPIPPLNFLLPPVRGGLAPLTYTLHPADALPEGLTFNTFTRILSGTPTETATPVALTYTVTNANPSVATLTFSLGVAASPTLESIADQVYTIQPVDFTLPEATGGAAPLSYTLMRIDGGSPVLPPGLTFDPAARTISGMPTVAFGGVNGATLRYTATDANGAAVALTFMVSAVDTVVPVFTRDSESTNRAQITVAIGTTPATTVHDANATDNGRAADIGITYTLDDTAAATFDIDMASGVLTLKATLSAAATYSVGITATDEAGNVATQYLTIIVTPDPAATDPAQQTQIVPADWALIPDQDGVTGPDFDPGESFRLLFTTSGKRDATSDKIADYNAFVQKDARGATWAGDHSPIRPYSAKFRALTSTTAVNARVNTATGTTGIDAPIYWLGNERVTGNYAGLYDGFWDSSSEFRNRDGDAAPGIGFAGVVVWTGTNGDGTSASGYEAGQDNTAAGIETSGAPNVILNGAPGGVPTPAAIGSYYLYALSPVFIVQPDTALSELRVTPSGGLTPDFDTAVFTYTATAPAGTTTVTVAAMATDTNADIQYAVGDPSTAMFTDSSTLNVVDGNNVLTVRVIAGSTSQDYTIMLNVGAIDQVPPTVESVTYFSDEAATTTITEALINTNVYVVVQFSENVENRVTVRTPNPSDIVAGQPVLLVRTQNNFPMPPVVDDRFEIIAHATPFAEDATQCRAESATDTSRYLCQKHLTPATLRAGPVNIRVLAQGPPVGSGVRPFTQDLAGNRLAGDGVNEGTDYTDSPGINAIVPDAPTVDSVTHYPTVARTAEISGPVVSGDIYSIIQFTGAAISFNIAEPVQTPPDARPQIFYQIGTEMRMQFGVTARTGVPAAGTCRLFTGIEQDSENSKFWCRYATKRGDAGLYKIIVGTETRDVNGEHLAAEYTGDTGVTLAVVAGDAALTMADVSVREGDGSAAITVTLDTAVTSGFTVDVSTMDGIAVAPDDYTALTAHTLTFAGTANETQTFSVTIIDDEITENEQGEPLTLALGNIVFPPGITTEIAIDTATLTITDNDTSALTIERNVSVGEGAGAAVVSVQLEKALYTGFTVRVATADDSAVAPGDYTAITAHTLTFAGNADETQTFSVTISDDNIAELDETLTVSLNLPVFNSIDGIHRDGISRLIVTDTATVTIVDNELSLGGTIADQTWVVGVPVALTLPAATGGNGMPRYSLAGDLPNGVVAANNVDSADPTTLTGAPTAATATAATLTYTVTDSDSTAPVAPIALTFSAVVRAAGTDAMLNALTVTPSGATDALTFTQSDGTTTGFDSAELTYTATARVGTTTVAVVATTNDGAATYTITGTAADGNTALGVTRTTTGGDVSGLTVGDNTITVTVTAEDGSTMQDYTITLTVPASTDATLNALTVTPSGGSAVTLTPVFDAATYTYTATAPSATTTVTVAAPANDSNATVAIAGTAADGSTDLGVTTIGGVVSGLTAGDNVITVTVTAEDTTTTRVYTITLTVRATASTDATLNALTVTPSGGSAVTLTPVFDAATYTYTATAPSATTTVTVAAPANDSNATVAIAGTAADGSTDLVINGGVVSGLTAGDNVITVTVTAEDTTTTRTYTITLTVPASTDATLRTLTVTPIGGSAVTLTPVFDAATYTYTATAPSTTTTVTVAAPANDSNATVAIAGTAADGSTDLGVTTIGGVVSGLTAGDNVITVTVTAEDTTTTRTYTITLTVPATASTDATLNALTVTPSGGSAVTLTPVFDAATYTYTATAPSATTTVTVAAPANDSNATVAIAGTAADGSTDLGVTTIGGVVSGLTAGDNVITVTVTAEDTTTTRVYTITLTVRATASTDATLNALTVTPSGGSAVTLTPVFDAATYTYTATAPSATTTVTVAAPANDSNATVAIAGTAADGSTDLGINGGVVSGLTAGDNVITVTVTAEDTTTTRDYTITLTVPATASTDATLNALTVTPSGGSAVTLTPVFAAATYTYTATAPSATTTVTVAAPANDSNATVAIAGTAADGSTDLGINGGVVSGLTAGDNVITVTVTAEDGSTTQDYTITLTVRATASTDATLNALTVTPSGGSAVPLTPVFDAATYTYTATAPAGTTTVTVAAPANDSNATVAIAGTAADGSTDLGINGGVVSGLTAGDNVITVTVTAEDGSTTQDYTITLTVRATASTDATLNALTVTPSGGSAVPLTPVFDAATYTYTATAPSATTTVTVAAPANDSNATVAIAGTAADGSTDLGINGGVVSGLTAGDNVITVTVTAEDGSTTQDYTITLTVRATASTDATLNALTVTPIGGSAVTLTPVFDAATYTYTATAPSTTTTVTVAAPANDSNATVAIAGTNAGGTALGINGDDVSGLTAGDNVITVTVTAEDGSTMQAYTITLTVPDRLQFAADTVADQFYITDETIALTLPAATGGVAPLTYTLTPPAAIPSGLMFDSAERTLTGTTGTTIETSTLTYTVTDNAVPSATHALAFTIRIGCARPVTQGSTDNIRLDLNCDSVDTDSAADGLLRLPPGHGVTTVTLTRPPQVAIDSLPADLTVGLTADISLTPNVPLASPATVCLPTIPTGIDPVLYHYTSMDDGAATWTAIGRDTTTSPGHVCGETTAFSPFAVGYAAGGDASTTARLNEQILTRTSQAMNASMMAAVDARVKAAARFDDAFGTGNSVAPAPAYQFGGQSSMRGILQAHGKAMLEGEMEVARLLDGASFSLPLSATGDRSTGSPERSPGDNTGRGAVAFWGSNDYRNLESDEDGLNWDGKARSTHLGMDGRLGRRWLAGLALSWHHADFDYQDAGNDSGGEYQYRSVILHPYFGWLPNDNFSLWGATGHGQGEIEIDEDGVERSTDTGHLSLGGGFNGRLLSSNLLLKGGTTTLNVKGDVSLTRVEVDAHQDEGFAAQDIDSRRLRLLLAGEYGRSLPGGGRLTPSLEAGVRVDDGDGETGTGVEVGGGLGYTSSGHGLSLSGNVRTLLAHDYDEWGADLTLRLSPRAGRGLSLRLHPVWGKTQSAAERLWEDGANGITGEAAGADGPLQSSVDTEMGYGMAATMLGAPGLLTPYIGMTAEGGKTSRLRLGSRFSGGNGLSLSIEGAQKNTVDGANHTVLLRGELAF